MHQLGLSALLLCAIVLASPRPTSAVTLQWSPVGDPGNANDPLTGNVYGGVGYNYNIGTYDVTNAQYAEFLNTKDPSGSNTLGLWNDQMSAPDVGGVQYIPGNSVGNKYVLITGRSSWPVTNTSWYDSIRFANWINNGQGSGNTETGAYTLGALGPGGVPISGESIVRNAGANVFLPSASEWYKAAYYNPSTNSFFLYPTSSDTTPIGSAPTALPNHANFNPDGPGTLTDVSAYSGTTSPYGAFDMGGNVWQWTEELLNFDTLRGVRGGAFALNEIRMQSTFQGAFPPHFSSAGFRLASVPEPYSLTLAAGGLVGLVAWGWRKRKA